MIEPLVFAFEKLNYELTWVVLMPSAAAEVSITE